MHHVTSNDLLITVMRELNKLMLSGGVIANNV